MKKGKKGDAKKGIHMNHVELSGRLVRDPDARTASTGLPVASFTLAVDRPPKKDGTKAADYIRVVVFGRQAEAVGETIYKGNLVAVTGRIQTGSYINRDGQKVYTTDVIADRIEFLEHRPKPEYKQTDPNAPVITNYSGGSGMPGGTVNMNPQTAELNAEVQRIRATLGDRAAANYMIENGPWDTIGDDDIPF